MQKSRIEKVSSLKFSNVNYLQLTSQLLIHVLFFFFRAQFFIELNIDAWKKGDWTMIHQEYLNE